jgi:hypothetical protein
MPAYSAMTRRLIFAATAIGLGLASYLALSAEPFVPTSALTFLGFLELHMTRLRTLVPLWIPLAFIIWCWPLTTYRP